MAVRGHRLILALAALALAGACATPDDARVLQVLNQRGFGRPTQDANRQYYLGIGDQVVIRASGYPEYSGQSERIRMDGTVTLADVREVYLNGLTPEEATEAVRKRYEAFVTDPDSFTVEVSSINRKKKNKNQEKREIQFSKKEVEKYPSIK